MWYSHLSAALARVEQQGRSGDNDWRPKDLKPSLDPPLDSIFDAAWRQGLPLGVSLAALRGALGEAADLLRAVQALQLLFRLRLAAGLVAVVAIRWGFLQRSGLGILGPRDRSALLLATAVIAASVAALSLALPRAWLGRRQLNEQAYAWVTSHLRCEPSAGSPLAAELLAMQQRELLLGVSLQREKREMLEHWSKGRLLHARRQLKRIEDLLPLWELIGIGLPVVLGILEVVLRFIPAAALG